MRSWIIIAGCLAALILRLAIVANTPTLAPEAYTTVREAEHIAETGAPFIHDPLRPGSNTHVVLPVFPYLLAFGTLLFGSYAYILIPNLCAVLLHAALFLLVLELTQQESLATMAMIASIAIPTYITATTLTASSLSLAIPLLVFILYLFIKLRKSKEKRMLLLGATIMLLATDPIGLLLIPVLLVALVLAAINRIHEVTIQYEFALFTTFLAAWSYLLLYKQAIIMNGIAALKGNLPEVIYATKYGAPNLLTFGIAVGVVPFGLAIYAAYKEGTARHSGVQTVVALAATAFLAVIIGIVPTTTGTTIVAIGCIILAAVGLERLKRYASTMRETMLPRIVTIVLIVGFVVTSIIPTVIAAATVPKQAIPPQVIEAGTWLRDNSLPQTLILTRPEWGSAIALTSKRAVFISDDYLIDPDSERTYSEARSVLEGERVGSITTKRRIQYIITNETIASACLNEVEGSDVRIMKVLC